MDILSYTFRIMRRAFGSGLPGDMLLHTALSTAAGFHSTLQIRYHQAIF
jgi:phage baseplate assembly protein W